MPRSNKQFEVWDPCDGPKDALAFCADTPEAAAEMFAEMDEDGVRNGLYNAESDFTLRVKDPDGDIWPVRVTLDWLPHFNATRVRA